MGICPSKGIIAQSKGKSNNVKLRAAVKKYKNDLLLIGGLLVIVAAAFLVLLSVKKAGRSVTVEMNGETVRTFDLSEDVTYPVVTEAGENVLVIRGGEAWIESADCRDKVCVHRGKVRNAGETIICLPHKLVVTVRAGGDE